MLDLTDFTGMFGNYPGRWPDYLDWLIKHRTITPRKLVQPLTLSIRKCKRTNIRSIFFSVSLFSHLPRFCSVLSKLLERSERLCSGVLTGANIQNIRSAGHSVLAGILLHWHETCSLRSWRDSWEGERQSDHISSRATLHQSYHGFAILVHGVVHGFATKTKALTPEIPPATQAMKLAGKPASKQLLAYCFSLRSLY